MQNKKVRRKPPFFNIIMITEVNMKILCIGDIVGKPGRNYLKQNLNRIINEESIDLIIANGENSAGGVGITKEIFDELISLGIDVITLGNHSWAKKEVFDFINVTDRIIRPANYPINTPGVGYTIVEKKGIRIAVINMCGRVFMECIDCPFKTIDSILSNIEGKVDIAILDFHAEATSEKIAMGWYLDGRISAIFGTHTHIQTSDEIILPNGTGYITDVGMTGPYESVLGMEKNIVIKKFITSLPSRFEVAKGNAIFGSIIFDFNNENKLTDVKRLLYRQS